MKLNFSIRDLLWLTLLVAIVLGFIYARRSAVTKWEYLEHKVLSGNGWAFQGRDLNPLGDDGWEACGIVSDKDGNTIFLLKRRK